VLAPLAVSVILELVHVICEEEGVIVIVGLLFTVPLLLLLRFSVHVPSLMDIRFKVWLAVAADTVTEAVPPVKVTVELEPPFRL
jgi:hypothetical protein